MKVAIIVVLACLAGAQARSVAVNWLNGYPQLELVESAAPEILPAPVQVVPETKPLPVGPSTTLPQIQIEWLPNGLPQLVIPSQPKPEVQPLPVFPEIVVPETKPLPAPSTKPQIEITWVNGYPQMHIVKPSTEVIVRPEIPSVQPPQIILPEVQPLPVFPEIVVPETKPLPAPSTKPQIEITWVNGYPQMHIIKPSTEAIVRPEIPSVQPPQIILPEVQPLPVFPEIVVPETKPLPAPSTKPQIEIIWVNGYPQMHIVKPSTEAIVRPEIPSVQPPQIILPEVQPLPVFPEIVVPETKPLPAPSTKPQIEIIWVNGYPQMHIVKPSTEAIVRPEIPSVQPPQIILPEVQPLPVFPVQPLPLPVVPTVPECVVVVPETRPEIIIPEIGVLPAPGGVLPELRPILPEFVPSVEIPHIIF